MGQKRFGLEGAESAIPILDAILEAAADADLDGSVIGMPHRGRLNVLTNIVGKSYDQLFKEFEGQVDPDSMQGSGDVKYHLGQTGKFVARSGKDITVELAANPSHLEAVDPVVVGMARAKQDAINDPEAFSVLPILMHGDAAFAGQGVVAETLNMSDIKGYRVGGTIHVVVNNQIGFTTTPESARSGFYSTDVAKIIQAPIFHVNGDDPEACVRVARLAFAFRQRFHKDVVIDMVCYRRHGHNEGDDPSYTQPLMYAKIDQRRSVRKLFTESLVKRGQLSLEEAEGALDDFQQRLQTALDETRQTGADLRGASPRRRRRPIGVLPARRRPASTGTCSTASTRRCPRSPTPSSVHPKLLKQFEARDKLWADGEVDWALAEAMAYGSLLLEGTDIRIAGQDTRRGTFSHRHAVLVDHTNGDEYAPLAHLGAEQGKFWIYDSLLSEYAALGFEYGYSVVAKDSLVVWEAQFGDFWNGASTIVDQFVVVGRGQVEPDRRPGAVPAPRLRGPGTRALLGAHRAVPHAVRRGQHPGRQLHPGVADLPPAAPPGAPGRAQAAGRVHAEVAAAGQLDALTGRASCSRGTSARRSTTPGSPIRSAVHAHRARHRQGGPRRHRRPRRGRGAGRGRAGRAALPVALRPARRDRRPLPERQGARVAPGGAREHGPLELREGPPLRALRRHATRSTACRATSPAAPPPARTPSTPRSRPSSSTAALGPRALSRAGSPPPPRARRARRSGSTTLIVVMPMARGRLEVDAEVVEEHDLVGSTLGTSRRPARRSAGRACARRPCSTRSTWSNSAEHVVAATGSRVGGQVVVAHPVVGEAARSRAARGSAAPPRPSPGGSRRPAAASARGPATSWPGARHSASNRSQNSSKVDLAALEPRPGVGVGVGGVDRADEVRGAARCAPRSG